MVTLSLVLPFALPAPEFAADLVRALQAPALAVLLSRHARQERQPLDAAARCLPHELWLARALGLAHDDADGPAPGIAPAAMRGLGLDPAGGTWFVVNPGHIQIARTHLMMDDLRALDLREDEARALFDAALPDVEAAGHTLAYGSADTWFMRADDWHGMRTASPDAAVGMNLTDWLPSGPHARAFRKLQNDVQVAWFTDPANAARERRGRSPVNAIWAWGGAGDAAGEARRLVAQAGGKPLARPALATVDVPGWMAALATHRLDDPSAALDAALGAEDDLIVVCGGAAAPAIAADWGRWLAQMQAFEAALFAPLHAALTQGRIDRLRLVLSHRDGLLDTTTTRMAQRKFWRRPTLEALTLERPS